jgi:pyruvate formate lyase activating enzyme
MSRDLSEKVKGPLVFDIGRGSFVDGPGMRTIVFFKGCPLRCVWCHNPESWDSREQMLFDEKKCMACGRCEKGCNFGARKSIGAFYPVEKLVLAILKDKEFYRVSNGGVTFSGGEPLLHIDYLYKVASRLKEQHIHIAVETSGYFDWNALERKLLPCIDLFLFDLKIMDPLRHKKYTGQSNEVILSNFKMLHQRSANIMPRVPLIPGFTDDEENLKRVAQFLKEQGIRDCVFLPYNPGGIERYRQLGLKVPENISHSPLTLAEEKRLIEIFNRYKDHSLSS